MLEDDVPGVKFIDNDSCRYSKMSVFEDVAVRERTVLIIDRREKCRT